MSGSTLPSYSTDTAIETKKLEYDDGGWKPEFCQPGTAIPAFILGTLIAISTAIALGQYLDVGVENRLVDAHKDYYYPKTSLFVFCYYLMLIVVRWAESDCHVLYEQLWACNVAMLVACIGMITNQPLLGSMSCSLVAIDQILWYVDLVVFALRGFTKFPIGVAAYLAWPTTSYIKKITSFHHIWFMPLMLWTLNYRMVQYGFPAACVLSTLLFTIGRFFTPFHCLITKKRGEKPVVLYLNINGGYAFWKDIKIKLLHIADHKSPFIYLSFLATFGNFTLNFPANIVLWGFLYVLTTYCNF